MAKPESAALYRVVFSEAVARRLSELSDEAVARGDGLAFAAAVKAFRERLAVYPQFGDPQIDLKAEPGVIRIGIIRPLSMRYGVYDERVTGTKQQRPTVAGLRTPPASWQMSIAASEARTCSS
jgi:hypothetical protein